jgi:integrase
MPYHTIQAFALELRRQPGVAARALEFTILTAARTGETIGMQWGEADLAQNIWTVPPARMKAAPFPHRSGVLQRFGNSAVTESGINMGKQREHRNGRNSGNTLRARLEDMRGPLASRSCTSPSHLNAGAWVLPAGVWGTEARPPRRSISGWLMEVGQTTTCHPSSP